ncbi:Transcription factor [Penicillium occitanis (nom. inval.)]|nr:Transcription factor [Penicillium occitanis (nom. inval.)]PCH08640.1 hypothetical protein PENOC_013390 [Penicillium occitanis (nom. inval.)]
MFLDMRTTEHETLFGPSSDIDGVRLDFNTRPIETSPVHLVAQPQPVQASPPNQQQQAVVNGQHIPIAHKPDSLADELKLLSLEAAADRHVGSSSGISFAKLTQAVLRRLSPDRQEFVFDDEQDEEDDEEDDCLPNETETTPTFSFAFNEMNTHLVSSPPLPLYFPLSTDQQQDGLLQESLSLIEPAHISHLLEFYFAHSHTLYPFVRQHEFKTVLWRLYADPSDPLAQSPLWQFRIWMVLAIGSTAYSSVSLLDESESVQLFNKAMVHFEGAMGCGDLAALEVLMLQVSYSFFNKIGPNTWILIGMAARMATGMGLHTAEQYKSLTVDLAEHQKRLFFCLYMMDRVVSLALGRPFAIQDDDITVEPFADVDDENIQPDGIIPSTKLEPSTMAIPLHILALRTIASDIGSKVHAVRNSDPAKQQMKEQTLQSLHRRLIEWRRTMPFPLPDLQSKVPHLCTNWFDFNYYTHVIMLYRPSPLCQTLDLAQLRVLAEASSMAIRQATTMHRQQRFSYNWLNLAVLFNATLSLMYSTTAQPNNLSQVLESSKAIEDLELSIELLQAFSRKFASAKRIQGMIQIVLGKLKMQVVHS